MPIRHAKKHCLATRMPYSMTTEVKRHGANITLPIIIISGRNKNYVNYLFISCRGMIEVLWVPPATFKSYCQLDLLKWPMDTQECKMKFGSWTHDGFSINLTYYNNMKEVSVS